jgi:hypothetical protein
MQEAWVSLDRAVSPITLLPSIQILKTKERQKVPEGGVWRPLQVNSVQRDSRVGDKLLTIKKEGFLSRCRVSIPRKQDGREALLIAVRETGRAANACTTEIP